jgi:hypothetical protein
MRTLHLWAGLLLAATLQPAGQSLLVNGNAASGTKGWTSRGAAVVERIDGVPCFTLRAGSFHQQVTLPPDAVGMFAALVGKGQADRLEPGGAADGLPFLSATVSTPDGRHVLAYWQGQQMSARPEQPKHWVTMSGVFSIPYGASAVAIALQQRTGAQGSAPNGVAARFSDVRLLLFSTEEDARAYVATYR